MCTRASPEVGSSDCWESGSCQCSGACVCMRTRELASAPEKDCDLYLTEAGSAGRVASVHVRDGAAVMHAWQPGVISGNL